MRIIIQICRWEHPVHQHLLPLTYFDSSSVDRIAILPTLGSKGAVFSHSSVLNQRGPAIAMMAASNAIVLNAFMLDSLLISCSLSLSLLERASEYNTWAKLSPKKVWHAIGKIERGLLENGQLLGRWWQRQMPKWWYTVRWNLVSRANPVEFHYSPLHSGRRET